MAARSSWARSLSTRYWSAALFTATAAIVSGRAFCPRHSRLVLFQQPRLRLEDDLGAVVLFVAEDLEAPGGVGQRHGVADDEAGIDLAVADPVQQRPQVALDVALAGPDGQGPVHQRADGELVDQATVGADHRHGAAVAAADDRLPEGVGPVGLQPGHLLGPVVGLQGPVGLVGLQADGVDAGVRAPAGGDPLEGVGDVGLLVV